MRYAILAVFFAVLEGCGGTGDSGIIGISDPDSGSCCGQNLPSPASNDTGDAGATPPDSSCCDQASGVTNVDAGNQGAEAGSDASPACIEGAKQCNGTTAQVCSGGKFQDVTSCSGTTPVCDQGLCVECTSGQAECVGTAPRTCAAGKWQYQPTCSGNDAVCLDGTCVECSPTTTQCSNGATPQVCSTNGTWQSQTSCTGTTPVCVDTNGVTSCVACTNGDGKCDGMDSYTCTNNQWVKNQTCANACLGKGNCVACVPNSTACPASTNDAETCTASGTWFDEKSACDPACTAQTMGRYAVNATLETVKDTTTGYVWQRDVPQNANNSQGITWSQASTYCSSLVQGPGTWRLPSLAEMKTLYETPNCFYGIDGAAFPNVSGAYWTATVGSQTGEHSEYGFVGGSTYSYPDATNNAYVMCIHN